ncbi:MAG: glycosyltransferase [Acidobacteria bacterium]|nr:glycosyltransferase [Acidobacteriota bacterium]
MNVLIITLTDDPFDPPGENRYGGAQRFMFDLGRHLVRGGHFVLFVTRQSRPGKPLRQTFGSRCEIRRFPIGPSHELSHHDLWSHADEIQTRVCEIVQSAKPFDSVLSFSWLSGLAAIASGLRPHVHHILSLGRVRRTLKESPHASDEARDRGEVHVFTKADRLICVCRDEFQSLVTLYPEIDAAKSRIVPYATDGDVFYRRPCDADDYVRRQAEGLTQRD